MRSLTVGQQTAIIQPSVTMVWFVELGFSTPTYLCTARHSLDWDGHTWMGAGKMVTIEDVTETDTMEATGYSLSVTLTSSALVSLALSEDVQGDYCKVWLALFDTFTVDAPEDTSITWGGSGITWDDFPILWDSVGGTASGQMIGSPVMVDYGVCDQVQINDAKTACSFKLTVESEMANFSRPKVLRYTNADQQALHPGDRIFEYVGPMAEIAVAWPSREFLFS